MHGARSHQHLVCGDLSTTGSTQQALGNHRRQRSGELYADLILTVSGEDVDDAIDGLSGVICVQRGEHEMAGFGQSKRDCYRLGITHLAHQDHIGILAQGSAQGPRKRVGVDADFSLRHDRLIVIVHVFNGIFDGDDMAATVLIYPIDQRRERRRFS